MLFKNSFLVFFDEFNSIKKIIILFRFLHFVVVKHLKDLKTKFYFYVFAWNTKSLPNSIFYLFGCATYSITVWPGRKGRVPRRRPAWFRSFSTCLWVRRRVRICFFLWLRLRWRKYQRRVRRRVWVKATYRHMLHVIDNTHLGQLLIHLKSNTRINWVCSNKIQNQFILFFIWMKYLLVTI